MVLIQTTGANVPGGLFRWNEWFVRSSPACPELGRRVRASSRKRRVYQLCISHPALKLQVVEGVGENCRG